MVSKLKGNLLNADAEALVNTVNTVGVMGKGIALQFKQAYPENFRAYAKACRNQEVEPGRMFIVEVGGVSNPRYIINFPTKRHWRSPSRIEDIERGLAALAADVKRLRIRSIALPPLGCGHGGLDWNEVYPLIIKAFADMPEVEVKVYEPTGAPAAEQMRNRTEQPNMTIGRAVALGLMSRYRVPGYEYRLSLLETQKLVYFQTRAGEPLDKMEFTKGPYGPYADTLRHVLERMEGHFISGYGDGQNKPETPITLKPQAIKEAEQFLAHHPQTLERMERVTRLIEGFETPRGMELLSSVHWVAIEENAAARSDVQLAIKGVHDWSERKRRLLPADQISLAWDHLRKLGWL
ncbi:MAG: macro domain-containing protein [Phycisphaerae bacterium]|jgi:O-acetyl-ADP-ribose deacetylase (regulator of RNase III)